MVEVCNKINDYTVQEQMSLSNVRRRVHAAQDRMGKETRVDPRGTNQHVSQILINEKKGRIMWDC